MEGLGGTNREAGWRQLKEPHGLGGELLRQRTFPSLKERNISLRDA
jgi:hypothetical protein